MTSQLTLFGESMVNTKSTRRTYTRESKLSVVAVPRYQLFTQWLSLLANYNSTVSTISTTQLYCHVHVLPKRRRGFGVWSNFAFIIKHILGNRRIFPCSFRNKRMRLLTHVYGIWQIKFSTEVFTDDLLFHVPDITHADLEVWFLVIRICYVIAIRSYCELYILNRYVW